jgi:hypothetical protein
MSYKSASRKRRTVLSNHSCENLFYFSSYPHYVLLSIPQTCILYHMDRIQILNIIRFAVLYRMRIPIADRNEYWHRSILIPAPKSLHRIHNNIKSPNSRKGTKRYLHPIPMIHKFLYAALPKALTYFCQITTKSLRSRVL